MTEERQDGGREVDDAMLAEICSRNARTGEECEAPPIVRTRATARKRADEAYRGMLQRVDAMRPADRPLVAS